MYIKASWIITISLLTSLCSIANFKNQSSKLLPSPFYIPSQKQVLAELQYKKLAQIIKQREQQEEVTLERYINAIEE